jgi:transcriptional regulator with XRE-family HTH domain
VDNEIKQLQEKKEKTIEKLKKQLRAELFTNAVRLDVAERGALWPQELSHTELFGILVRNVRLFLGLSEAKLAKRSGLSMETISRVENGKHKPREKTVEKLARALEVPPKQLDTEQVFRRWPAVYQTILSQREVAVGELERIEREKAPA